MTKNIVILTMGLEIGGAETHIIELAAQLKKGGHNVTVFSSGGVYVEHLKSLGIHHITAPMNSKKPSSLIRSGRLLRQFCKKNKVSVIHSHTRITNFIASGVCKKFHIPLVTTVHFNFRVTFFTKMFSRWGQRALSVSEDLKDYVANNYAYDRDRVRITVNGINLNTFSQGTSPSLRAEYNLNDQHKVILCVSRIDTGACENVFTFLQSAEQIFKSVPEARIIVVGNGNRFGELQRIADDINSKTTTDFIQLVGAQTNIADYCRMADAFAGVSRSALEAMACRLPTLLIGNSGYLGVYSKETHQACIDTNFTYRGYPYVSSEEVAEIMIGMLKTPERYAENIEAAYRLVEKRYSVVAMANDALASYSEAADDLRPNDLMISGYYGTGNFGDEITLRAIIDNIAKLYPIRKVAVLCHNTEKLPSDECITPIHRFNLFKILPLMTKTKLFMLGGGSLLQDSTSNRSIFYYLFMLYHAHKLGCKTMLYGNGFGPVIKKRNKENALKILAEVDRITVRDNRSYLYLTQHGIDHTELTADEAYNYTPCSVKSVSEVRIPEDKKILLINLRTAVGMDNSMFSPISQAINAVSRRYDLYPVLMPAQFEQDFVPLSTISKQLDVPHHLFTRALDTDEIISMIDSCDYLLAERLHPIIFAAYKSKPFVCIEYDPKIRALAVQYDAEEYVLSPENMQTDHIIALLENMIQNGDILALRHRPIAEDLSEKALRNSRVAAELLQQ